MPRHTKHFTRAFVALCCLALVVSACELVESATADRVLAGTVMATPEYDFNGTAFGDAGYTAPDGGSLLPPVPSQTVAQIFFGSRDPKDLTKPPTGVSGAKVSLSVGGKSYSLTDKGSGNYMLTTIENKEFVYQPGAEYKLTITNGGNTYTASVTAPQEERVQQFHATPGIPLDHTANQQLQVPRERVDNIAFTTVVPMSQAGKGDPTYTDFPSKPLDLLDLVANDSKWKQKTITMPGTAFPQTGAVYLVNVAAVEKGDTSENLFTTSVFLVGSADLGLVKTQ